MASDRQILISPDRTCVLAENGPMRLAIRAWCHGRFQMNPAIEAAEFSFTCLEQVAGHLKVLQGSEAGTLPETLPAVCQSMVDSVRSIGDPDLTTMASVAGAIADAVADYLVQQIRSENREVRDIKVIVDNGGDLAVRLSGKEKVKVGLRTDLNTTELSHTMTLDSKKESYGVNTSGMGGRSFTRGIASATTVLAPASSTADAAATAIANACFYEDKNILQVPAGLIDPHTDIPNIPVTVRAVNLSPLTVKKALKAALDKADRFKSKGLIYGAFIACRGCIAMTRPFDHAGIISNCGDVASIA
jgi:uncharacterized protein